MTVTHPPWLATLQLFDVSGTGAGIQWPDMSFQAAEGKMVKAASSNRLLVARTRTASDSLHNLGPSSTTSRSQRGAHCGAVTSSLVSGIVEACVTGAEDGEVKVRRTWCGGCRARAMTLNPCTLPGVVPGIRMRHTCVNGPLDTRTRAVVQRGRIRACVRR